MYIAAKKYKILCHESCYHVKNIKVSNRLTFKTIEEGLSVCIRVCKICNAKPWKPKK